MTLKNSFLLFIGLAVSLHAESGMLHDHIRQSVLSFIETQVDVDSLDVQFYPNRTSLPVEESNRARRIQILWDNSPAQLSGRVQIPVRVSLDGGDVLMISMPVHIRKYVKVWVTQSLMNRHHVVEQSDLRTELREISNLGATPIRIYESLIGLRTRRVVGKNRILTNDMIETPPAIERGDRVTVCLTFRNLKITRSAIARQDGWVGDQIRVRDTDSRTEITGLVKNAQLVLVEL